MKYLALTHTAHRIYDMKLCSTNEEAEEHIMSYIRNKLNCTDYDINTRFGGFRSNPTATYCFSWKDGTTPDTELLNSDPFYKKDTNCTEYQSTVYDIDEYDKYLVYVIGHQYNDIISEGVCGFVDNKDATSTATDYVDDLKDLLIDEQGYDNKEIKVNKLTNEILAANTQVTYKRVVVIDLTNLTVTEDLTDPVNQTETVEKEVEHELTPQEISAKAAEDAEIRRTLQHTEYETKKKLHEVLSRLSPEQYTKFLEMALVLAAGVEATMVSNDKPTETSTNSNDNSNSTNVDTVDNT